MKKVTAQIFRDYGVTLLAAILIAVFLRFFIVEAYRIPSNAMKPTLLAGDFIFVSKWQYSLQSSPLPSRGDVVVYTAPNNAASNSPLFIKRVIALPGDVVEVTGGRVLLNKRPLSPPPLEGPIESGVEKFPDGPTHPYSVENPVLENFGPEKVPEQTVFVLGDARTQLDLKSRRSWGMVPLSSVKGKAIWIWLSIQPVESSAARKTLPVLRMDRMFRRIP